MRQLTANEILSISRLLQMETNALAIAKTSLNVVSDDQLRSLTQSGIATIEGRIQGLQQFVIENNLNSMQEGVQ